MAATISTLATMITFQADHDADHFLQQCSEKGLEVNSEKTEEIVVDYSHGRSLTNGLPETSVGGVPVKRVEDFQLVGFTLSNDLCPAKHIQKCLAKANSRLFLLYKMRNIGIPVKQLYLFYDLSFLSIFDYVAPAYHNSISEIQVKQIEKIRKRARKCLQGTFGPSSEYSQGVDRGKFSGTLKSRRDGLCANLFDKYLRSGSARLPPIRHKKNGRHMTLEVP
jgi:hypothetical protein